MMDNENVNAILGKIFSHTGYIKVICTLYERELTASEISLKAEEKVEITEIYLKELLKYNIVRKRVVDEVDRFTITDNKICDSVLILKDTLYKISHDNGIH